MNTLKHLTIFIFLTAIIFFGAAVKSIDAATFTVNIKDDTHDVTPGDADCRDSLNHCTLRAAIEESNALAGDDTIFFSTALTGQTIVLNSLLTDIDITSNITINGLNPENLAVSGNNAIRVFNITGGNVIMRGFTIRDGNAGSSGVGGGIYSGGGALTLENMFIRNNTAIYGGGIYVSGGSLNMTGSTIIDNNAIDGDGGGIYSADSTVTLTGVSITGNRADNPVGSAFGGGMFVQGGSATVINCTIAGNTTKSSGGGASFLFGTHRISGTTFSGNTTQSFYGGGFYIQDAIVSAANSTVSGNAAGNSGGGIYTEGGGLALRNVTVAGNTATNFGGGINNSGGATTLANTIVADNTAPANPDINGRINSLGNNLVRTRGSSTGYVASDLPDGTNPLLGALANNGGLTQTRALMTGSPAINNGNNAQALDSDNTTPLTTDQRGAGFPRIVGGTVDIGAYESGFMPSGGFIVNTVADTYDANPGNGICLDFQGTCSLRAAIQESNALAGADTITFASGLSGFGTTLDPLKGSLDITNSNVTIDATGIGSFSVSGGNAVRVFNITNGSTVVIRGLIIRDGNAGSLLNGGGIFSDSSALTLTGTTVSNNAATFGGGIYVLTGNLTMAGSIVSNNNTTGNSGFGFSGGGGIFLNTGTVANITNSRILNNNATDNSSDYVRGGGIYSNNSTVTLTGASITGNHVSNTGNGFANGGGMFVSNGNAIIINCTVAGNTVQSQIVAQGGGAFFYTGTHRVSGTTFSGNSAQSGGGLVVQSATMTLANSTVSDNAADGVGGIYNYGNSNTILRNVTVAGNNSTGNIGGIANALDSPTTLANTIVADNIASTSSSPDISGAFTSLGNNLVRTRGTSSGYVASDLPDGSNPMLGALANNGGLTQTHALLAGSAAINAGNNAQALDSNNTTPLTTDQRGAGFPRIVGGTVDIGAFEVQTPTAAPVTVGGRVTTAAGRGISRVFVMMTGSNGETRTTMTNPFGYYRFDEVAAGETYIFTLRSKRFQFGANTQIQTITEDTDDINFVANN